MIGRMWLIYHGNLFIIFSSTITHYNTQPVVFRNVACFINKISIYIPFTKADAFSFTRVHDPVTDILAGGGAILKIIIYDVVVTTFAGINIITTPVVNNVVNIVNEF